MIKRQRFTIPFRLPSLNEYVAANRQNPHAGAKLKRETDEAIGWAIKAAHLHPIESPCIVCMVFHEANRKRDVDNVESAKKYIVDSLVKCDVLQGDSPRYVIGVPSYTDYREGASVDVSIIESEDTAVLHGMLRAGMQQLLNDAQ